MSRSFQVDIQRRVDKVFISVRGADYAESLRINRRTKVEEYRQTQAEDVFELKVALRKEFEKEKIDNLEDQEGWIVFTLVTPEGRLKWCKVGFDNTRMEDDVK